jgi:hypothetical protein
MQFFGGMEWLKLRCYCQINKALPYGVYRVLSVTDSIAVVKDCEHNADTSEILKIFIRSSTDGYNLPSLSGKELTQQICRRIPR